MIPSAPEISVTRIPLDVAGETILRQTTGYFHMWRFEYSADGLLSLDGEISAVFGAQGTQDDAIPLTYNSRVQMTQPVDLVKIRWNAQPGLRAVLVTGPRGNTFDAANVPAKQIVTPEQGAFGQASLVPVVFGVRSNVCLANSNRLRLVVTAPDTNTAPVFIGNGGSSTLPVSGQILNPGASFVFTNYRGNVFAMSQAGTQNLRCWEERTA